MHGPCTGQVAPWKAYKEPSGRSSRLPPLLGGPLGGRCEGDVIGGSNDTAFVRLSVLAGWNWWPHLRGARFAFRVHHPGRAYPTFDEDAGGRGGLLSE